MPVEHQPPEVLALLVADHVHRDEGSGKFFILGTRSWIGAATFPHTCPGLAVYAVLADGRGETTVKVRLIDVDETRDPVVEFETVVAFLDPSADVEVAVRLVDLVFPEPGEYSLQVYGAGQFLRERRLFLVPLENPGKP